MTCERSSRTSAPASLTDKGLERHIGTVVMRRIRLVLTVSFSLLVVYSAQLRGQVVIDLPLNEPEVFSIFPLGGLRGTVFEAELRGRFLDDAYGVWFDSPYLKAQVKRVDSIEPDSKTRSDAAKDRVTHRIQLSVDIDQAVGLGTYALRLVTPRGISNAIPFIVDAEPAIRETESLHFKPDRAQPVNLPAVLNGRISNPGEVDYYSFQVHKNEELVFEVFSKPALTTLAGQRGFDTELALYELAGSWFDSNQVTRLAFSDEAPSIEHRQSDEDVSTNSRLTYRFSREGRYLIQVSSFLGKGGPDCTYQLRIAPARKPTLLESEKTPSGMFRNRSWHSCSTPRER